MGSPHFASLRSLEQLDALATRYHVRPSALADERDPYRAYCLDEAAALAGEARETRMIEAVRAPDPPPPVRRVQGLLVGSFSREV